MQFSNPQVTTIFTSFLKCNSDLTAFTGLENFETLEVITNMVKQEFMNDLNVKKSKIDLKDKIVMTYIKLRLNLTYSCLSTISRHLTEKECCQIFIETIKMLSKCLKNKIIWPSREESLMTMPTCFKEIENVRVVLNCIELSVQNALNQSDENESLKCMIGFAPLGNISFISELYDARISNAIIFQQSKLVSLLEPNDIVMINKDLLINQFCTENQLICIGPTFSNKNDTSPGSNAELTSNISKAWAHIDKINQQLKEFKILDSKMPIDLILTVEEIIVTLCGTINLNYEMKRAFLS